MMIFLEIENMHPALDILILINNLKTSSARNAKNQFADHFCSFSRSRCFGIVFTLLVVLVVQDWMHCVAYVDEQGTM